MTSMLSFLALPMTQTIAWALVHFLWQGAVIALVAGAVMRWVAASAHARYLTGVASLGLMLIAPLATFVTLQTPAPHAAAAGTGIELLAAPAPAGEVLALSPASEPLAPPILLSVLVGLWLAGVLVLSVRLLGGWIVARGLATAAGRDVDDEVRALASRVAERLQLSRLVRVAESTTVAVPVVVGWLKPVVLLPAAALSGLAPAHIEALLAHELAHVRRHDYLVNLLQSAVETLLFYHPGVWWVSRRVRIEREHCCDDLAVSVCDRFVYVDALTDLAAMTSHARLALAATDGSLLRRVRRLLSTDADDRPAVGWISMVVLAVMAAAVTPALVARGDEPQATTAPPSRTAAATPPGPASMDDPPSVPATRARSAAPPAARATANQSTELEALQSKLREAEARMMALRAEQRAIEARRVREELNAKREAAVARLESLQRELRDAAQRVEVGLASEQPLEDIRAMLAEAERNVRLIDVQSRTTEALLDVETQRAEVEQTYGRLQQEYAAARAEAEAARRQERPDAAAGLAEEAARERLAAARRELDEVRARYSPNHPNVQLAEARLRAMETQVSGQNGSAPPPGVHAVGGAIREPRLLRRIEPAYPPVAKAARQQGAVYIQAIIGRDGRVRDAQVTGGAPFPALHDAALAAVRQWVYEPTMLAGEPVEVQVSVQVMFRLDGGNSRSASAPPVTNAFPVNEPTARVQEGDILLVDIAGEDQLPRWYVVESGGRIRLPLIGTLTVGDLTADAARTAVTRALAERSLAAGKAVTVTIHRPRGAQ